MPGRDPRVGVEDQVARPRVAVARLADAAGVEQRGPAVVGEPGVRPPRPRRARGRRPGSRPSGRACGRAARPASSCTSSDALAIAAVVTYSQVGSRRLPWTSEALVDDQPLGEGREPVARRRRDPAPRPLHRPARLRVEGLDLGAAGRRRVVVAADADRADARRAARPRRRARGRSPRRRRGARPRRPCRCRRGPRRVPRGCCGCPTGRRSAWAVSVAAACSPRSPCPRRGIARIGGGRRPGGGHHDQRMAGQRRQLDRARARGGPRRARRAPAGPQRAPRPGRRASRRRGSPPGTSSGTASSTRSGRAATARAVTHGQAPRWAGSRASASARTAATATGAMSAPPAPGLGSSPPGATAATAVSRKRAFLPVDSTSSARRAGRAIARGRPGKPPPEPRSTNASMPIVPKERHGRQAVEDVRDGDLARVADGGQVDRRGPGEEQPDVAVDGGPLRGGEDQSQPVEPGLEGVVVRGGKRWEALDARRERLTRGLQGTPPVSRADRPAPCHSRRHRFAPRA